MNRQFTRKRDKSGPETFGKKSSNPFMIKEMQIKATLRQNFSCIRLAKIENI